MSVTIDDLGDNSDNSAIMATAIGVLTFIFLCSLVGLLYLLCRRQAHQAKHWNRLDDRRRSRPNKSKRSEPELAMALNDIGLGSALEQILNDEKWMDDATGVLPHCLAILRTCHSLTERLAELAMRPLSNKRDSMHRLIESTKRLPYRVDDVVRSMHPPLDLRLLEARLAALVLAVGQVALLTQSVSLTQPDKHHHFLAWIDDGLNEMDAHLLVLREASQQLDDQHRTNSIFSNHNTSV